MELREYQKDCIASVNNCIDSGVKKMAVVISTGGGKTVIFGKIIKDYLANDNNNGSNVVVVSHLGLLTKQTGERFKSDFNFESEVLQADIIPLGKSRCIITTMQSFKKESKIKQWGRNIGSFSGKVNVGMIIIDEAHYVGSDTYDRILCSFPNAIVIGFTATPFRGNRLMTDMFDKVAYTISTGELIDMGFLVKPELKMFPFDKSDESEMFSAIISIIKESHKHDKCVVYLKTIKEAKDLSQLLVDTGITSKAITSHFSGDKRDKVLSEYRKTNEVQVLTTVDVLTAGFDSPNLKVIIMPYKVSSVTSYLQRVGRGLRIYEGKDKCYVYCGATSPKVDKGFWERVTTQMLKQGKADYDNYQDDIDFLKGSLTEEEYLWTMDIVNLAKSVSKKMMPNISEMILSKQFPVDLLNQFVEQSPVLPNKKMLKEIATPSQISRLKDSGIDARGMSRGECLCLLSAVIKKNGSYNENDIIQSGKYKGYFYNEVPTSYWSMMNGNFGQRYGRSNTGILKGYNDFKQRRSNGRA